MRDGVKCSEWSWSSAGWKKMNHLSILIVVIAGSLVLAAVVIVVYCCCFRKGTAKASCVPALFVFVILIAGACSAKHGPHGNGPRLYPMICSNVCCTTLHCQKSHFCPRISRKSGNIGFFEKATLTITSGQTELVNLSPKVVHGERQS